MKHCAWVPFIICVTGLTCSLLVHFGALLGLRTASPLATYLLLSAFPSTFLVTIYFNYLVVRFTYPIVFTYGLSRVPGWNRGMYLVLFLYILLWIARAPRHGNVIISPVPELISSVATFVYFSLSSVLYAVRPGSDVWRKW